MLSKPSFCSKCPMFTIGHGYAPPQLNSSKLIVLGEAPRQEDVEKGIPFYDGCGSLLNNFLAKNNIERAKINVGNVMCCRPPMDISPADVRFHAISRADAMAAVQYCISHHYDLESYTKILAVGELALRALTGKRGILVWRGSPLPLEGKNKSRVIPTISPIELMKKMTLASAVINDMGKLPVTPPENYNLFASGADIAAFKSKNFAFDFEWDEHNNITIAGVTDRFYNCLVTEWDGLQHEFKRIFESATDLIGHNIIGADTKQFARLGWNITARLHDTMLKQHLLQPDYKHDLGFVASIFTNKTFWKGRGHEEEDEDGNIIATKQQWRTWDQTGAIPREIGGYGGCLSEKEAYRLYNARDTDASFQINAALDPLLAKWGLDHVYWNVCVPIAFIVRDIADAGIRIDNTKVASIREVLLKEVDEIEQTLPDGLRPIEVPVTRSIPAPAGTYKPKTAKCKGKKPNKHEPVEITFRSPGDKLECPTCGLPIKTPKLTEIKRVKVQETETIRPWASSMQVMRYAASLGLKVYMNRKRGTAAADVNARKAWGRTHPEFRIIDQLKDAITICNNFAKDALKTEDRLYFNLLVHGTSEGRFSSSGKRKGIDPNIQNQPKSVRKIYIPDQEDWSFLELDYASAENMLTAFLAGDTERLAQLRQPGFSEHLELAKVLFDAPNLVKGRKDPITVKWTEGKQVFEVNTTEDKLYDTAKVVNHGGNYGMTHVKLQEELEANGFFYSERKCKEFIQKRKELNPKTSIWQDETISRAKRDGYLRNPFGRIRWFSTRSVGTVSLAFLPASTLADIIIRAMIAHYPDRFPNEIARLGLGKTALFEEGWKISAQIHDSLLLQGPSSTIMKQAAKTKELMCQPWPELNGFSLDVEMKGGQCDWGSLKVL